MTGEKTLSIDYPQLENPKISDLRRRMREDRNWGAGIMSIYLVFENVLESAFTLIISIIVVFPLLSAFAGKAEAIYAVLFFVFMFALIVVYMLISRSATKKEHRIMDNTTISGRLFNFYISDGIDYKAGKDIRMYKAQKLITNKGQKIADLFAKNFFAKVSHSSGFALGIGSAISTLIQGGSYLFIALGAAAGSISIGATVRYAGSIFRFSSALSELCTSISYLSISAVRTKSAIVYFAIPDVLYHGSLTTEKRADNDYAIEFHNVSFKYPGSSIYALKNLSLNLNVGERIAVVGMNGSGKTTMIKLLYRLYDPTEGQITLNGIDIRKYNYDEYIGIFSVVFQDFRLFSFPLGQNVAASMDVNQIRARECLLKAGFGKRLDDMQKGLDTCLYREFEDDGIEISGGEAQKIALARALYKNAPFVILDEPTAALDPIAEYEIYTKINDIVGEKPLYTFLTACLPAGFVMISPFFTKAS
ncbi:MAG: ATP-binding cassette domain-containing protein [Clostridiales bacterium]|nr:ATP-binding cassette domain-containing protein [Clostridiales bacterium]